MSREASCQAASEPARPALQAAAATALIRLGEEAQALDLLQEGLKRHVEPALLAVVPLLRQPAPRLLAQLQKWEQQTPQASAPLLQAIGSLLLRQRDFDAAQAYLERALALEPDATTYRALAELMEQLRLFEKASTYYRLSLSPTV